MIRSFLVFIATVVMLFLASAFVAGQAGRFGFPDNRTGLEQQVDRKLASADMSGALALLEKAINQGKDVAIAYKVRAQIRIYQLSDYQGALLDLDQAIKLRPDDFRLFESRARLKSTHLKDNAGAIKDLESARSINSELPSIYAGIADLKAQGKDYAGAIVTLSEGTFNVPNNIDLRIGLAEMYGQIGQPDKGLSQLTGFLKDLTAKRGGKLPKVVGERVKKQIPSDIRSIGTANVPVTRYSQTDMTAVSMADVLRQQDEMQEARSLARAYLTVGRMYAATNKLDEALSALATASDADRNNEDVYELKGAVYLTRGEASKAVIQFDNAIDIADKPAFYLNRGIAFFLLNDDKRSQKDFDTFIKLYPDGKAILSQRMTDAKQFRANPPAGTKIL